jgi:hypothetical protein
MVFATNTIFFASETVFSVAERIVGEAPTVYVDHEEAVDAATTGRWKPKERTERISSCLLGRDGLIRKIAAVNPTETPPH